MFGQSVRVKLHGSSVVRCGVSKGSYIARDGGLAMQVVLEDLEKVEV